jgi:hypothetical protein
MLSETHNDYINEVMVSIQQARSLLLELVPENVMTSQGRQMRFVSFINNAIAKVFKLTREEDFRQLGKTVAALAQKSHQQGARLRQLGNVFIHHAVETRQALNGLHNITLETQVQLRTLAEQTRADVRELATDNKELIIYSRLATRMILEVIGRGDLMRNALSQYHDDINDLVESVRSIRLTKALHPKLISPEQLKYLIKEVNNQIAIMYPEYTVSIDNVRYFYEAPIAMVVQDNGSLYVRLTIPVSRKSDQYYLYQPLAFDVPTGQNNTYTKVSGLTDLVAVNVADNNFLLITMAELSQHCTGTTVLLCQKVFLRRSLSAPGCITGILRQDTSDVLRYCNIHYKIVEEEHLVPVAYQISHREYLLTNYPATLHPAWIVQCGAGRLGEMSASVYSVVRLNCSCGLLGEIIDIPASIQGCVGNLTTSIKIEKASNALLQQVLKINVTVNLDTTGNIGVDNVVVPPTLTTNYTKPLSLGTRAEIYELSAILENQELTIEPEFAMKFQSLVEQYPDDQVLKYWMYAISCVVPIISIIIWCLYRKLGTVATVVGTGLLPSKTNAFPIGQGPPNYWKIDMINTEQFVWYLYLTTTFLGITYLLVKNLHLFHRLKLKIKNVQRRFAPYMHITRSTVIMEVCGIRDSMMFKIGTYQLPHTHVSIHNGREPVGMIYEPGGLLSGGRVVFSWQGTYLKTKFRNMKANKIRLPNIIKVSLLDKALLRKVLIDNQIVIFFLLENEDVCKVISRPISVKLAIPESASPEETLDESSESGEHSETIENVVV